MYAAALDGGTKTDPYLYPQLFYAHQNTLVTAVLADRPTGGSSKRVSEAQNRQKERKLIALHLINSCSLCGVFITRANGTIND